MKWRTDYESFKVTRYIYLDCKYQASDNHVGETLRIACIMKCYFLFFKYQSSNINVEKLPGMTEIINIHVFTFNYSYLQLSL